MATTVMEAYYGTAGTATWQAVGANKIGFTNTQGVAASASAIDSIAINTFQSGTHVVNGTPTDICTNPHVQNFKYLTGTTWSINGGASAAVSDTPYGATTAATGTGGSFRWHFNDSVARVLQNVRIYVFNNTVVTTAATDVDVAMHVSGNSMTAWQVVNDYAVAGPTGFTTGSLGGDNTGPRITGAGLARTSTTDGYWYCAASVSVENAGVKTAFAFGIYVEYV